MPTVLSKFCAMNPEHGDPDADADCPILSSAETKELEDHERECLAALVAAQGNRFVPYNDKAQGVRLENGQMRLEVQKWRDRFPKFISTNNTADSPKGGLDVKLLDDTVLMQFKIPDNFPDGMIGFMTVLQHLFHEPEKLGMLDIRPGCEAVNRELKRAKSHDDHVKWTSPWDNFGCRVSWMKENPDSSTLKFKFSSINKMGCDEEMIVTVDEHNLFFKQISASDPNTYGQWLSQPARIWLRTQWIMRKAGSADNDIFNKLSKSTATDKSTQKTRTKKQTKLSKQRKASPKSTQISNGNSKRSNADAAEASKSREESSSRADDSGGKLSVPDVADIVLCAGTESVSLLGQMKTAETIVKSQAVVNRSVQRLTIDTDKSNVGWRGKYKSGAVGATVEEKHDTKQKKSTNRRGASQGVHTDIAHQDVPTEQQLATVACQTTVHASLSPTTPIVLDSPMTSPLETARTHLSPSPSLPSTTLSQFFTPIEEKKGGVEVKAEQSEPGEFHSNLRLTPLEEFEVKFRWPVSGAELCESDPELYTKYRMEALEADSPCRDSPAAVRLGLFEGLQRITVSSPTNPPLTSRTLADEPRTADDAELATEDTDSVRIVTASDKAPAKSRRVLAKKAAKRRKSKAKRRVARAAAKAQRNESLVRPFTLSPNSYRYGWEGPTPSPAETSEEELTLTAMQFGGNGLPSMLAHWDLSQTSFPCARGGCQNQCSFKDGRSVVCPGCGPFSLVRYCGKEHLWEDVKDHWATCGTYVFVYPCITSSVPKDVLVGPPMLPNIQRWDRPERHRQAVWFTSASNLGDYFVFQEVPHPMVVTGAPESHEWPGCSPQTALTLRFAEPEEKDRFRRVLAVCLFMAPEHPALAGYLYRLIRDWVRGHYEWPGDNNMDRMLANQLALEMGVEPQFFSSEFVGQRHACEMEWIGDPNPCSDPTCVRERRHMSLDYWGVSGFQELCEKLESLFWLLRAHRTTHPSVRGVVDRMHGKGYEQARGAGWVYPRGDGWDGAGTGPMVIEAWW